MCFCLVCTPVSNKLNNYFLLRRSRSAADAVQFDAAAATASADHGVQTDLTLRPYSRVPASSHGG